MMEEFGIPLEKEIITISLSLSKSLVSQCSFMKELLFKNSRA
jgi:hypothetical protein